MAEALLILLTLGVAFANGANDVSKGVATLVGSRVSDLQRALRWGTGWTVAGGIAAAFASRGLVAVFSGEGLLAADPSSAAFLMAIGAGAVGWLVLATVTGMPVSTTHALVGALVGAGIASQGVAGVQWVAVVNKTALPLAVSPVLALGLMIVIFPGVRLGFRRFNRYCVCVEREEPVVALAGSVAALVRGRVLPVVAGADCPPTVVARVNALDSLHWLSSGGTSFFRGMNDTPKILALGVLAAGASGIAIEWMFVLVAAAMGLGSYIAGARVTETLAGKVTTIRPDDGFAANLVTSALVGIASWLALPVSTTHVSSGAIAGVGVRKREVRWRMLRDISLAWLVTLPVAALIAGATYGVVG